MNKQTCGLILWWWLVVAVVATSQLAECNLRDELLDEVALAKPTIERALTYLSELDESAHSFSAQQLVDLESAFKLDESGCSFEHQKLLAAASEFFADNKLMSIYLLRVLDWQRKFCELVEADQIRFTSLSLLVEPKLVSKLFGHSDELTDEADISRDRKLRDKPLNSQQAEAILVDRVHKISSEFALQLLRLIANNYNEKTLAADRYSLELGNVGELVRLSELTECDPNDMRRIFAKSTQFSSANLAISLHFQNVAARQYKLCSAKSKKGLEAKALSLETRENVEMLYEHVDLDAFNEAESNIAKFRILVEGLKTIAIRVLGPHGKPDKFYTRFGQGLYHSCVQVNSKLRKHIKITSIDLASRSGRGKEFDQLRKWSTIYQLCEFVPNQLLGSDFVSDRVQLELRSQAAETIYTDFNLPPEALWDTLPLRVPAEKIVKSVLKQAEAYGKKRSDLKKKVAGKKYIQDLAFVCRNHVDPLVAFAWLNNAGYLFEMTKQTLVGTFIVIRVCDALNRVGLTNLENYWREKSNSGMSAWLDNIFHTRKA